jgi:glycosyltransferase involved in cell wall biosynthesis
MLRAAFARLLSLIFGESLFIPSNPKDNSSPLSVVVLSPGESPTTDLYLRGRLEVQFGKEVRYVDSLESSPLDITITNDSMFVIVRYAPIKWLHWLKQNQKQLAGVVFLMDDDIPSAFRAFELPLRYAIKTTWRYIRSRQLLSQICNEIWLSTPELMQRYASSSTHLVEPKYIPPQHLGPKPVVYFYHGTWAHKHEIQWLVAVIKQIQTNIPNAWFEIIGTDQVKQMFRGIPRVRVVHPMTWNDYLAYSSTVSYQVGLAPCFDTDFNRARSHSKFFDITRIGAVGVYSNVTPYKEKIIPGKTGLTCDNEPEQWVAALSLLLKDQILRESLYSEAKAMCEKPTHPASQKSIR